MQLQYNHQQTQNTNNNNQLTSNLHADASAFNVFQLSEEQLFIELQSINNQLTNLKLQANHIIFPTLVQINQKLLLYDAQPQLLQIPINQFTYNQLQQQKLQIQQHYFQNQQTYQQLQQQLQFKQQLYHQIKNEPHHVNQFQVNLDDNNQHKNVSIELDHDQKNKDYDKDQLFKTVDEALSFYEQQLIKQLSDSNKELEEVQVSDHEHITETLLSFVTPNNNITSSPPSPSVPMTEPESIINHIETMTDIPMESTVSSSRSPSPSPSPSIHDTESTVSHFIASEEPIKDTPDKPLIINEGEIRYDVTTLFKWQSEFVSINWTHREYQEIPRSIRVMSKAMRTACHPWLAASDNGPQSTDNIERLKKKLRGVLNKMTPENFDRIAVQTMNVVNEFAESKDQMKVILGTILQFAIEIPVFGNQYALLCKHLFGHLTKLKMICEYQWILNDDDLPKTFRQMIIVQTNELFKKHRLHSPDDIDIDKNGEKITDAEELEIKRIKLRKNFFAVCTLVAELYNVDLVSTAVVYKGLFDVLLPPMNTDFTAIDIEGLCDLLKRCGQKLDDKNQKRVSRYLQKLVSHSKKFDFRTQVLVDEVKEMRDRNWEYRIKKDVAKTKEEIREEFEQDYAKKHKHKKQYRYNNDNDNYRRGSSAERGREQRYYGYQGGEEEEYNIGYDEGHNDNDYDYNNNDHHHKDHYDYHHGGRYNRYSSSNSGQRNRYNRVSRQTQSSQSLHGHDKYARYKDNRSWDSQSQCSDDWKNESSVSMKKMNENEITNKQRRKPEQTLSSLIDEYLVSGVMDDILAFECDDYEVFAVVINNGLRDRKSGDIEYFIDLIVELFQHGMLNNKHANFVNYVVNHLAVQLDDSSMDCPLMIQYIAKLFARLCYYQYLNVNSVYDTFTDQYRKSSSYLIAAKKKNVNKMIKYSIEELQILQASQSLTRKVNRYFM